MSILEVSHVSIRYMTGDFKDIGLKEYVMRRLKGNYRVTEFWADRDITFSLEPGEMLGIIGTNGAGKSTLLKAISGIMEPTKGRVQRNGSIAALLELASGFDGDLTVRENAYLRGAMLGYTRKFMDEAYGQIIDFAELRAFEDRPFKQLSSGMKSRLAFAIAAQVQPDILILDEVLSVGDGAFRKKSEAKMREIMAGGATTILVSHSIQQVRELCNKVLWLEKGEQIAFGDTQILCVLYQQYLNQTITLAQAKQIWAALNRHYDYLIVGSGLFGAVFAREAADHGKRCLVVERRANLGGNIRCGETNGVIVHQFGAHIFHTSRKEVWDYVSRFARMTPVSQEGVARNDETGDSVSLEQLHEKQFGPDADNLEELALSLMGEGVYHSFFRGWLEKLWGRPCKELPASMAFLPLTSSSSWRGIPEGGYNHLIEHLLEGIETITGLAFQTLNTAFPKIADKVVYTGAVDQLLGYCLGRLEYRSLRSETEIWDAPQGQGIIYECGADTPYLRTVEYPYPIGQAGKRAVIVRETVTEWEPGREPLFPVRTAHSARLYEQYRALAKEQYPNFLFGGCLGAYRCCSMDEAVADALELARREFREDGRRPLRTNVKIAVAGLGYVGMANAVFLARHQDVTAVDLNPERVAAVQARKSPVADSLIPGYLQSLRLNATCDLGEAYRDAEYVVVAVPTDYALEKDAFDTAAVEAVIRSVIAVNPNAVIVIRSTVPVGYTQRIRERLGCRVLFCPEFLREGTALQDCLSPSRIIVGAPQDDSSLMEVARVFADFLSGGAEKDCVPILLTAPTEAEAVKLFANSYLALRVAFFNELDTYAELRGLNAQQLIEGIGYDPRIGNFHNNPSFGYGGCCLPKDVRQLRAEFGGMPAYVVDAAIEANRARKDFIAERVLEKAGYSGENKGGVIGVYRLAMKAGSDNFRQSSVKDIIRRLKESGAELIIYEPLLEGEEFLSCRLFRELDTFVQVSRVILANRFDEALLPVRDKVYTRDLYQRD